MNIKVKKCIDRPLPIDIVNEVEKLLRILPSQHLRGLEKIVLVDSIHSNVHKKIHIEGIYRPRRKEHSAYIEIAVSEIIQEMPTKIFYYFPYWWQYLLARVLYHEVGHHYMQSLHNIREEKWEFFAEKYMRQMIGKAFPGTRMIARLIHLPGRILKIMRKGVNKGVKSDLAS